MSAPTVSNVEKQLRDNSEVEEWARRLVALDIPVVIKSRVC